MTRAQATHASGSFDAAQVRADFPVLDQRVHDRPLVYLDNAATTQKPRQVIEAVSDYYMRDNSNVHRGVHVLSERATAAYEGARDKVRAFLKAAQREEIIFTRGTTEGINLVAQSYLRPRLRAGDEILITGMEHHSNIVPWQLLCEQTGALLKVVPISDEGELNMDAFEQQLSDRTRLLGVVQVSNALGTVNPIRRMVEAAHAMSVPVLVDGAQAVAHQPVDVQALGADFYVFSSHKIYGPTGLGVLYGRRSLLEQMPPYQGGGDMILTVTFEKSTWNALPYKFEAGTPHIAGAVGLGAALDYVQALGLDRIAEHEQALLDCATDAVREIEGLRLVGTAKHKAGILSFIMDGIHPHDIGTIVDTEGVAIRTGHHCAMPVMERFGIPATARASFAAYNTRSDVDALVQALRRVKQLFAS